MLCHLGPEQTDHTINVNPGLLLSDTEFEFPTPLGAPEPTGPFRIIGGIILAEEVEETAQDGVEVENRNFAVLDDPATPWDDRQIGFPAASRSRTTASTTSASGPRTRTSCAAATMPSAGRCLWRRWR